MKLVIYNADISNDSALLNSFDLNTCILHRADNYPTVNHLINSIPDIMISHIVFVYHFPGFYRIPFYPDDNIDNNYVARYKYFSNNLVTLFTTMKSRNPDLVVDILACDMNYSAFMDEVVLVESDLGITIRYSIDKSGNNNGSDWILESHGADIKALYFNSNIDNWTGALTGDQGAAARSNTITGISYNSTTKVFTQTTNINWLVDNFIILNAGERYTGNAFTTTVIANGAVAANTFAGFFAVSTAVTTPASAPTVENVIVAGVGLGSGGGYIIRQGQEFFVVRNSRSSGDINNTGCGGISGTSTAASSADVCIINNCFTTGAISGIGAGGICGSNSGNNGGAINVYNCYSTGAISGTNAGGIAGDSFGQLAVGMDHIYNCYSLGNITGNGAGGICGANAGISGGNCVVYNCYSRGIISGTTPTNMGGICGLNAGSSGNCLVFNCYTLTTAGGTICGANAGANSGRCAVCFCYAAGTVTGVNTNMYSTSATTSASAPGNLAVSTIQTTATPISTVTSKTYSNSTPVSTPTLFSNPFGAYFGSNSVYTFNLLSAPFTTTSNYPTLSTAFASITCFTDTANILTTDGYVNVTKITVDHSVVCSDGHISKVVGVTCFSIPLCDETRPYTIPKNSLGDNYPPNDVTLSGNHLIWTGEKWLAARNVVSAIREEYEGTDRVVYYHIKLQRYSKDNLVVNGGTIVESLCGKSKYDKRTYKRRLNGLALL
jgi:hypothetical protein